MEKSTTATKNHKLDWAAMGSNLEYLGNAIYSTLGSEIGTGISSVCIIDVPDHPNVGDSVIFLGELEFINRLLPKAQVTYFDVSTYRPGVDRFIESVDLLFIHGGGNFGDLWPEHHQLRCEILSRFAHKRIIQFPQSINFSNKASLDSTAALIANCRDFLLVTRDEISYKTALDAFDCKVMLTPDMAFALTALERKESQVDCFCLLRTDKEVAADHRAVQDALRSSKLSFRAADWLYEPISLTDSVDKALDRFAKIAPACDEISANLRLTVRKRNALNRMNRGIALLSQGRFVITDRLHAHILCFLMDIPHVVLDSLDGKISSLYRTWTDGRCRSRFVSTAAELGQGIKEFGAISGHG